MVAIEELFSIHELDRMIEAGYIRVQTHPEFPELTTLNYTEKAQFEKVWNDVTRICRGLIFNSETREVLARPFQKIHNWDESEAPRIVDSQILYSYSNKYDGSLGIGYLRPDGRAAIATRGSFASDQALHATQMLWAGEYESGVVELDIAYAIELGMTPLFEIIYPDNRIVLDYAGLDDLVSLGSVNIADGSYSPNWWGAKRTMHELLMDLSRDNAEGWVAWLTPWKAVKIKQADYVELHRIVTGLNRKSIWRALRDQTLDELLPQLPDELYKWAEDVADEIAEQFFTIYNRVGDYHKAVTYELMSNLAFSQKDFAITVQKTVPKEYQGMVFSHQAGKDVRDTIFKMIEPFGNER